ncbi:type III secretion system cytoplasmic ring protein SctQ [Vibrio sp. S4M6]|uniref:type III secretion system cytoplasmic ring protein SctQ n=1 Tax=Vibrio sinus TaxID=2946865 RepID=UPI00202A8FAD|nr:type III secretion system cytoplasmic ring protein SctQ [Vibrio sinus]MCL9783815.1 type III secretion system cytoplasmic ring protein SctQ [Vibrio sinus]
MDNSQTTDRPDLVAIQLPEYSSELIATHQIVGQGLHSLSESGCELELSMTTVDEQTSHWLCIEFTLMGEQCSFYFSEDHWLDYIHITLPIDKFSNIPPELHPVLSSASLSGLCDWANENGLEAGNIGPIVLCEKENWGHSDIQLAFTSPSCSDKKLSGYLCGLSNENLRALSEHMTPQQTSTQILKVPISCAVGLSVLTFDQLKSLQVGGCVLLRWCCNFDEGEVLLVQNRPISVIRYQESGSFIVDKMMSEFDELLDLSEEESFSGLNFEQQSINLDSLMVNVVLEVGHVELAVNELANLATGSILETELKALPQVRLKANGKIIGLGSLLQVGDRLGVRVDELCR